MKGKIVRFDEKSDSNIKFDKESLRSFFREIMREETIRLERKMEDMVNRRMNQCPTPPMRTPPVEEKNSKEKEFFILMRDMMSQY